MCSTYFDVIARDIGTFIVIVLCIVLLDVACVVAVKGVDLREYWISWLDSIHLYGLNVDNRLKSVEIDARYDGGPGYFPLPHWPPQRSSCS
jgi:hypothetical protein